MIKVVVEDLGVNSPDVRKLGVRDSDTHWVYLEWKKGGRDVFGPVLIVLSDGSALIFNFAWTRADPLRLIVIPETCPSKRPRTSLRPPRPEGDFSKTSAKVPWPPERPPRS